MSDGIEFVLSAKDATGNAFNSVAGKMGRVAGTAGILAAGAAAATAAIFKFTKTMAESIESTADFAEKLKLPVDEFSKYQAVATAANIETQTFNMSMQQLYLSTDKAAKGLGEDSKAFQQLGINAREFKTLGMDQQMGLLAERISGVTDAQQRMTIATTLFGARGSDMLKIVGQNSEALQKAAKDAEFLGLVIGPQMAANAKAFGDGFDRASGALKGVSMSVANEFMPIFTGAMNRFADYLAGNRENIVSFVKSAIQGFFTFGAIIGQIFDGIKKLFTDRTAQTTFINNLLQLPAQVGAIAIAIGKALFIGVWEGFKLLIQAVATGAGMIGKIIANMLTGKDAMDGVDVFTDYLFSKFDAAKDKMATVMQEAVGATGQAMSDIGSGMAESFGVNLDAAQESARAAIESLSMFGEVAREQIQATGEVLSPLMQIINDQQTLFMEGLQNNTLTFFETLRATAEAAIDNVSTGMAQAIVAGTSLAEVFRNVAKQVVTDIIAAFIKMGIQRLILSKMTTAAQASEASSGAAAAVGLATANGIASWALAPWPINTGAPAFGAAMGSAAAGGFSAGAATGAALGNAIGIAGARADGGPVSGGKTYLVGERGPELFTPGMSGSITSNEDLAASGGGAGGVTIQNLEIRILDNATNADAFFQMSTKEISKLIADPVIMALNDLNRKGVKPDFVTRKA